MKKLLFILGAIFLLLIVAAGVFVGYAALTGSRLDKESKTYVDVVVPAIVSSWSIEELQNRASQEFRQATNQQEIDRLFQRFRTLGRLLRYQGSEGQAMIRMTPVTGKMVFARYLAKARFENGDASIDVGLVKHGDQWQIARFKIDSPALTP